MRPLSIAAVSDMVLNTEPGCISWLTARFCTSRYTPSSPRFMLASALMSPVLTSISIATPYMPSISFSFSTRAFSQKSCRLTSMVVYTLAPCTGCLSITGRYLFIVFTLWAMPGTPASSESNCFCRPEMPRPLLPSTSPRVRAASEPKGLSILLNTSVWKPEKLRLSLRNGRRFTSLRSR